LQCTISDAYTILQWLREWRGIGRLLDDLQVDLERRQGLSNLIVQFACDAAALRFLRLE
jgi:hypothetical protein